MIDMSGNRSPLDFDVDAVISVSGGIVREVFTRTGGKVLLIDFDNIQYGGDVEIVDSNDVVDSDQCREVIQDALDCRGGSGG